MVKMGLKKVQYLLMFISLALNQSKARDVHLPAGGEIKDPEKRTSYDLWYMTDCARPDLGITDLWGYGCYCGPGGGGTPVDDFDRCCQTHDKCYHDQVQLDEECGISISLDLYTLRFSKNECNDKEQTCKREEEYEAEYDWWNPLTWWSYWPLNKIPISCRVRKCQCDYEFSQCIRFNSYNTAFRGHSRENC